MILKKFAIPTFFTNIYILGDEKEVAIIDPGAA